MQFPENCNYDTLLKQNHAPCRCERAPCDAVVATGGWDRSVRNHTPPAAERDQVDHLDCGQCLAGIDHAADGHRAQPQALIPRQLFER
jgi:hypothetical protein